MEGRLSTNDRDVAWTMDDDDVVGVLTVGADRRLENPLGRFS